MSQTLRARVTAESLAAVYQLMMDKEITKTSLRIGSEESASDHLHFDKQYEVLPEDYSNPGHEFQEGFEYWGPCLLVKDEDDTWDRPSAIRVLNLDIYEDDELIFEGVSSERYDEVVGSLQLSDKILRRDPCYNLTQEERAELQRRVGAVHAFCTEKNLPMILIAQVHREQSGNDVASENIQSVLSLTPNGRRSEVVTLLQRIIDLSKINGSTLDLTTKFVHELRKHLGELGGRVGRGPTRH